MTFAAGFALGVFVAAYIWPAFLSWLNARDMEEEDTHLQ